MKVSPTLVLVDDDHDDYEIFSMALSEAFPTSKCIYFDSAKEAFAALTSDIYPLPDYVFLDLNMPGMNGLQFLEQIKQTSVAHIRIVVYSTSILPHHRDRIKELGVFDSFLKPFSHIELINILRDILNK